MDGAGTGDDRAAINQVMLNEVRHDRGCGRPAATTTRGGRRRPAAAVPCLARWRWMLQCSSASPAWRSPSRSWTFSAETRRSSWRVGTDGARSWRSRSRWRSFPLLVFLVSAPPGLVNRRLGAWVHGLAVGTLAGLFGLVLARTFGGTRLGSGVIGGAGGRRHGRVGVACDWPASSCRTWRWGTSPSWSCSCWPALPRSPAVRRTPTPGG